MSIEGAVEKYQGSIKTVIAGLDKIVAEMEKDLKELREPKCTKSTSK